MNEEQVLLAPSASIKRKRTPALLGSVILLVLIIVGALWFYPKTNEAIREGWSILTLPTELKGSLFVVQNEQGTGVYKAGTFGLKEVLPADKYRIEVMRNPEDVIAITQNPKTEERVVEIHNVPLIVVPSFTTALSVSPSGKQYAFMNIPEALNSTYASGTTRSIPPQVWETRIAYPATQQHHVMGSGFAPFFISETELARFTQTGLYSLNLVSGETRQVLNQPFPTTISTLVQSPNREYVAWIDVAQSKTAVYRIQDGNLSLVRSIPKVASVIFLGDKALYELTAAENEIAVVRHDLSSEESKEIHRLPTSLGILRLVL